MVVPIRKALSLPRILQLPTADIAAATSELTCNSTSITLDATGSTVQGTASYAWTGGSTSATLAVTAAGTYTA